MPPRPEHPTPVRDFLRSIGTQVHDALQRFRHRLIVHRATQTRTGIAIAGLSTLFLFVASSPPVPACPVASTTTTLPPAPAGWRVVALPAGLALPRVHPGDTVDVIADGQVIAPSAIVTAAPTEQEGALVAVPAAAAAPVASAAQSGGVALVLAPG